MSKVVFSIKSVMAAAVSIIVAIGIGLAGLIAEEYILSPKEFNDSAMVGVFSIVLLAPFATIFYAVCFKYIHSSKSIFSKEHIRVSCVFALVAFLLLILATRSVYALAALPAMFIPLQSGFSAGNTLEFLFRRLARTSVESRQHEIPG